MPLSSIARNGLVDLPLPTGEVHLYTGFVNTAGADGLNAARMCDGQLRINNSRV